MDLRKQIKSGNDGSDDSGVGRPRRNDIVRVRQLSSGPNPCVGVTIPSYVLYRCGLDVGDRVYVVIEDEGKLIVERVRRTEPVRYRDRSKLVSLSPADLRDIKDALLEVIRLYQMESSEQQQMGNRKLAKLKLNRADRLRHVADRLGDPG